MAKSKMQHGPAAGKAGKPGKTHRASPRHAGRRAPGGRSPKSGPLLRGLLPETCPVPEWVSASLLTYQPRAGSVYVAGTFNGWESQATPLIRLADGEWSVQLTLKPGRYEYRFVVDGEWKDDPMASRFVANPFGGLNSVIEVPWPA